MSSSDRTAFAFWWKELERWTVPAQSHASKLPEGWYLVRIAELVQQVTENVKVYPDIEYKLAGVRWYGNGVFHRETVKGSESSATYLMPLIPGSFIYNRLFAWKESFAVVPESLGDCLVSNEFPQFRVDFKRILPHYLFLFFLSPSTVSAVNRASIGSSAVSRNRFKEEAFLDFHIPLPPLSVQQGIVNRWQQAQADIAAAYKQSQEKERIIAAHFVLALGLTPPKDDTRNKVFASSWKDFTRWSVSFNQAASSLTDLTKGKYSVIDLGAILEMVQYGTSEKANQVEHGTPVLRINNIKDGHLDITDLKHIPMAKKQIDSLHLVDGDILIIRTNGSRDLVGTCAVFHEKGDFVFASYLIRLRVKKELANPDYVTYYINSPLGRQQVDSLSRQIMQSNINSQELRCIQIPLPPLQVQQEIMKHVVNSREEIALIWESSQKRANIIKSEIESLILGTKMLDQFR
jgi:type I restriction enzyme, S subunit